MLEQLWNHSSYFPTPRHDMFRHACMQHDSDIVSAVPSGMLGRENAGKFAKVAGEDEINPRRENQTQEKQNDGYVITC